MALEQYWLTGWVMELVSDGFASRILTDSEQRYTQIEREALACVFGVKKFYSYLYSHHFILIRDHKPLLALFSEHQVVPTQVPSSVGS